MEIVNPLGEEKVSKLLMKFSVPAIVGMMVNAAYNIIDRIFIGNSPDLGANGLAGITIGFPIMIILMSIGILFGVGGATLFSIKLGEGKKEEAEEVLGNSFAILIISGIIFMIIGELFLEPILVLFGASKEVLPYSMTFMRIIFLGAVFQVVSMGMNSFLRADGQPTLAMITMFMGAGTNIVLDAILINWLRMGMAGAAIGTVTAQILSSIWIMSYFFGKKCNTKIKLKNMRLKRSILVRITSLGMPGFLMQLVNSLLNVILNKNLFIYGGDLAVSGMGIVNSLQTILLMPVTGLTQGVQPIVSFNFGAKKYHRVKEAEKLAITVATVIVLVGYIVTRLFPDQLVSLFNQDPKLVEFSSYALKTWFMSLPVIGFQIIASNYFQSIGRSKTAIFLTLTRQVILLIPAILIFSNIWGITGLLHSAPFSDLGSSILTGTFFYFAVKNLGKNDRLSELETEQKTV